MADYLPSFASWMRTVSGVRVMRNWLGRRVEQDLTLAARMLSLARTVRTRQPVIKTRNPLRPS
jgi:hypothetical protein